MLLWGARVAELGTPGALKGTAKGLVPVREPWTRNLLSLTQCAKRSWDTEWCLIKGYGIPKLGHFAL